MSVRMTELSRFAQRLREADGWRRLFIGLASEAFLVAAMAAAAALAITLAALVGTL